MCLYVDNDYYELLSSGQRKARVSHRCDECERTIDPGEFYSFWTIHEYGYRTVETQKMCAHCWGTIEIGSKLTGCPKQWYWGEVHNLDPEMGFVGNIIHDEGHDLSRKERLLMLSTVRGRKNGWRKSSGELYRVPQLAESLEKEPK